MPDQEAIQKIIDKAVQQSGVKGVDREDLGQELWLSVLTAKPETEAEVRKAVRLCRLEFLTGNNAIDRKEVDVETADEPIQNSEYENPMQYLGRLPEIEQLVIESRYLLGENVSETAKQSGLAEKEISRIEKLALKKLRNMMEGK